jgi:flagellar hook assembly protein FlgD
MRLLLAILLPLVLRTGVAHAQPSLVNPGVVTRGFSPNHDGIQDAAVYFFTLAGDSALVTVLVQADSLGVPGKRVRTLAASDTLATGTDTLQWDGNTDANALASEGVYWITARAVSLDSTTTVSSTPVSVFLDITAPRDSLILPAKLFTQSLVHEVKGVVFDANGFAHLDITLFARGITLADSLCPPCAGSSAPYDFFVPDSMAASDTLRITVDALDPAGNGRPQTVFVVVDSVAPPPPVLDPIASPIDRDSVQVMGTADQADSVFLSFDGAPGPRLRLPSDFHFDVLWQHFPQGTHTVVAQSVDKSGNVSPLSAPLSFVYREILGVVLPERFTLGQYLQVNLSKPANAVLLRIYDLSGRLVKRLEDRSTKTIYEFGWDLSDQSGNPVGSGPYVVNVEADYTDGSRLSKRLAMVVTR